MFRFANPQYFWLLPVIPALILLFWLAARNRRIRLHFARPELSGDNAVGVALMGIDRLISTQKEAREHGGDVD